MAQTGWGSFRRATACASAHNEPSRSCSPLTCLVGILVYERINDDDDDNVSDTIHSHVRRDVRDLLSHLLYMTSQSHDHIAFHVLRPS